MEFRELEKYPGYKVSNVGDIIGRRGRIMRKNKDRKGYYRLSIQTSSGEKYIPVHRLVAMAWVNGMAEGLIVNHIDGNKTNNHYLNLEWVTYSENNIHAINNGLRPRACSRKLDDIQVLTIKTLLGAISGAKLADHYKVTQTAISSIKKGNSWANL